MSEHIANILWNRGAGEFRFEHFSRAHTWTFDAGVVVPATSAPAFHGDPERVDPEEAFVAALSSCHMLTFLAIAARKRFTVEQYSDEARGALTKNEQGKFWISRVTLSPKVVFSGEKRPTNAEIAAMHHTAHENCFIALSVRTEVSVEPQLPL
jgi:organic hydroperoxide reductase OsmC/OhrA